MGERAGSCSIPISFLHSSYQMSFPSLFRFFFFVPSPISPIQLGPLSLRSSPEPLITSAPPFHFLWVFCSFLFSSWFLLLLLVLLHRNRPFLISFAIFHSITSVIPSIPFHYVLFLLFFFLPAVFPRRLRMCGFHFFVLFIMFSSEPNGVRCSGAYPLPSLNVFCLFLFFLCFAFSIA
jgi:hypothetical protein